VAAATLQQLHAAFEEAVSQRLWAVVPEYGSKHGHPIVVGREMIEQFLKAPLTSTARDIEHQNQAHIQYVRVTDPFVATNVDTPADYAALSTPAVAQPR
jgi:CTP:molybdopterin cytidylyltransferase MocA